MKIQLTLVAAVFSLFLTGCQVEGLAVDGEVIQNPAADTNTASIVPSTNTNTNTNTNTPSPEVSESNENGVMLYWSAPTQRVSGASITMSDIQGYEIRYKKQADTEYTVLMVEDAYTDQMPIDGIDDASEYLFEVAAIDKYGIYSKYVTASNI